jgi:hypothetical protein
MRASAQWQLEEGPARTLLQWLLPWPRGQHQQDGESSVRLVVFDEAAGGCSTPLGETAAFGKLVVARGVCAQSDPKKLRITDCAAG